MKWHHVASLGAASAMLVAIGSPVQAQDTMFVSLSELACTQAGTGGYWDVNHDLASGREFVTAGGYMGKVSKPGVYANELIETVCSLAPTKGVQRFNNLTLSFGFGDDAPFSDEVTAIRLALYRDGQLVQEQVVRRGERGQFFVDVANARTITLDQHCINTARGFDYCPNLYFFEDKLEAVPLPPPIVQAPPTPALPPPSFLPPAATPPRRIIPQTW